MARIARTRHKNLTTHVRTSDASHQTREGGHTPEARSYEPPSQNMRGGRYLACSVIFAGVSFEVHTVYLSIVSHIHLFIPFSFHVLMARDPTCVHTHSYAIKAA